MGSFVKLWEVQFPTGGNHWHGLPHSPWFPTVGGGTRSVSLLKAFRKVQNPLYLSLLTLKIAFMFGNERLAFPVAPALTAASAAGASHALPETSSLFCNRACESQGLEVSRAVSSWAAVIQVRTQRGINNSVSEYFNIDCIALGLEQVMEERGRVRREGLFEEKQDSFTSTGLTSWFV